MCPKANSVAILLATYNGANFLVPQLNSFKNQSYCSWELYVSDDGSSDDTLAILEKFSRNSPTNVYSGPQKGFARNFLSLINRSEVNASYYAFSDQDDIWCDDKLKRAVDFLSKIDDDLPALYCCRTTLIDSSDKIVGYSTLYKKKPGIGNALIQNIASGNTMVFNHAARKLLNRLYGKEIIAHDWSLYQIVAACGGAIFYDANPGVLYRQHDGNLIGSGLNYFKRFQNFIEAVNGRSSRWNDINLDLLSCVEPDLSVDAKKVIHCIKKMRSSKLVERMKIFHFSGLYHQTTIGTLTNYCYAMLNKI